MPSQDNSGEVFQSLKAKLPGTTTKTQPWKQGNFTPRPYEAGAKVEVAFQTNVDYAWGSNSLGGYVSSRIVKEVRVTNAFSNGRLSHMRIKAFHQQEDRKQGKCERDLIFIGTKDLLQLKKLKMRYYV